jgi:ABC-type nitrate/sulfonate/bicarbonate transport system ATPase subunit
MTAHERAEPLACCQEPPGLAVRGVTVDFRCRDRPLVAVADLDLDVAPGEFVSVVGPSGCGKSTLLRALAGLVPISSGTVRLTGATADTAVSTRAVPDRSALNCPEAAMAWHPQADSLLPWRRALGNAMIGARIAGASRAQAERRARELFAAFGLAGFERAWPSALSGGLRQRVAVLRTALTDRPVWLLDEPFGALDALLRREMNQWLAATVLSGGHADERGGAGTRSRTVILVTHDVEEAITLSDRVVVMSARPGRVIAEFRIRDAASEYSDGSRAKAGILDALGVV